MKMERTCSSHAIKVRVESSLPRAAVYMFVNENKSLRKTKILFSGAAFSRKFLHLHMFYW